MISFVKSKERGLGDDYSYGFIVDKDVKERITLFGLHTDNVVTFIDVVNGDVIRDVVIKPKDRSTVIPCRLPERCVNSFNKTIEMLGSITLGQLAKIREKYGLNYQQAEFVLLAFHIDNNDQEAFSCHMIWRDHVRKKASEEGKDLYGEALSDIDLDAIYRTELPYLSDADVSGLLDSGFLSSIEPTVFKINRAKYYNEIFINKQIAYQQLIGKFKDKSIRVKDHTYKICNVLSRSQATDDYWSSIECSITKHVEVLEACDYALDHLLVEVGLIKIIANELYHDWVKIMNGEDDSVEDTSFAPNIIV